MHAVKVLKAVSKCTHDRERFATT